MFIHIPDPNVRIDAVMGEHALRIPQKIYAILIDIPEFTWIQGGEDALEDGSGPFLFKKLNPQFDPKYAEIFIGPNGEYPDEVLNKDGCVYSLSQKAWIGSTGVSRGSALDNLSNTYSIKPKITRSKYNEHKVPRGTIAKSLAQSGN